MGNCCKVPGGVEVTPNVKTPEINTETLEGIFKKDPNWGTYTAAVVPAIQKKNGDEKAFEENHKSAQTTTNQKFADQEEHYGTKVEDNEAFKTAFDESFATAWEEATKDNEQYNNANDTIKNQVKSTSEKKARKETAKKVASKGLLADLKKKVFKGK
eukprot:gene16867-5193_t